jgi:hypothetical protein
MTLALFLHRPSNARYIVLLVDGVVQQAAGPLEKEGECHNYSLMLLSLHWTKTPVQIMTIIETKAAPSPPKRWQPAARSARRCRWRRLE